MEKSNNSPNDKSCITNRNFFTQWKKADEEWHTLSLTLVGSMVTPIVISAIPVASISAGYATLSTEAFEASIVTHYEINLGLNYLRKKALEGVIGGAVAALGKDAMYSSTLWKMSGQASTPSSPINGSDSFKNSSRYNEGSQ